MLIAIDLLQLRQIIKQYKQYKMDNPFLRPSPVFNSSSAGRLTPTSFRDRTQISLGQANDYQYRIPEGNSSLSTSNLRWQMPTSNLFSRDNYSEGLSASQRLRIKSNVFVTKQLNLDNSFTGRLPYQSSKNPFVTDSYTPKREKSFVSYNRPSMQPSYHPASYRASQVSQDSSNSSYVDKLLLYTSNHKSPSFYPCQSAADQYLQKIKDKQAKADIKDNYKKEVESYDITPEIRTTFGVPYTEYGKNRIEPAQEKLESFEEVSAKYQSLIGKFQKMGTAPNDKQIYGKDYASSAYQMPSQGVPNMTNIRQTTDNQYSKYSPRKYDIASNGIVKTETFQHFEDSQDGQQFTPKSPSRFPPKPFLQSPKIATQLPKTYEFKDFVDDNASFGSHDSMSDSYGTKKVQISLNPQSGCDDYCKEDFIIPKNLRAMPSQSLDKLLELDDPESQIKESHADNIQLRGKVFYRNVVY